MHLHQNKQVQGMREYICISCSQDGETVALVYYRQHFPQGTDEVTECAVAKEKVGNLRHYSKR